MNWRQGAVLGGIAALGAACGGEVVGIGNSENQIGTGHVPRKVVEMLAESPGNPRVTDKVLEEIFSALVGRASQGEPEAALIVLAVAQHQREDREE